MEDRENKGRLSSDQMEGIRRPGTGNSSDTTAGRAVRSQIPGGRKGRTGMAGNRAVRGDSERTRRTGESASGMRQAREGDSGRTTRGRRRRPQDPGSQISSGRVQRRPAPSGAGDRRQASKKLQARRRRKRNLGLKIALFIILIIAAAAAVFLWKRYSPSKEKADRKEYYGIENESQMAVIIDNDIQEPQGMMADGKAYLQYELVRDHVNSRFYWDPNENILLYTLPNDTVTVEVETV